jgi:hypothetical protein
VTHSYGYVPPEPRNTDLTSADVVVSAPMSFAGSAQRIWRLQRYHDGWAKAGLTALALLLITVAWVLVLNWYVLFGLALVPYRLIRRGQRKQRLAQIRHQELMNRVWAAGGQPPYPPPGDQPPYPPLPPGDQRS